MTYRWLDGPFCSDADWERVQGIIDARRWMSLNRAQTRILIAEQGDMLAGFVCLQFVPHLEPLFVAPSHRGTEVADTLVNTMVEWLRQDSARGWMVTAEHPSARKMCEARGWIRVEAPVFVVLGER